jgi:C1A family cysteine protease
LALAASLLSVAPAAVADDEVVDPLAPVALVQGDERKTKPRLYETKEVTHLPQAGSYPTSFDMRGTTKVLPVRDQGAYGTCWTFSATAVAGASLVTNGLVSSVNTAKAKLSPKFLAYAAYGPEGLAYTNTSPLDVGGDFPDTIGSASNYWGPALESQYPYPTSYPDPSPITSASAIESSVWHLDHAVSLPIAWDSSGDFNMDAIDQVKFYLYNYGPVAINIMGPPFTLNSPYLVYGNTGSTDHSVTIVGWNDKISANSTWVKSNSSGNATSSPNPPGPGAWIIQNSWGTGWADKGYYYLSYYDKTVSDFNYYSLTSPDTYDINQSYSVNAAMALPSYTGGVVYASNVYTASTAQTLEAVMVSNASVGNSYTVNVYTNVSTTPTSGTLSASSGSAGNVPYGIQTVPLSAPIYLKAGTKYAVVVKYQTQKIYDLGPMIELERQYTSSSSNTILATVPSNQRIQSGQSYYSYDGKSWSDMASMGRSGSYASGNFVLPSLSKQANISLTLDGTQPSTILANSAGNVKVGNLIVGYPDGTSETIPLTDSRVTVSSVDVHTIGKQTVNVTFSGKTVSFTVYVVWPEGEVSLSSVYFSVAEKSFTGKKIKSGFSVTGDGVKFTLNKDYKVSATGANTAVGKGTITITGLGRFTGTKTLSFSIVPKTPKISRATAAKGSVKVSWAKQNTKAKLSKLTLRYRQSGTTAWKTKSVSAKSTSVTIKGLKKGKKYQFELLAYRKTGGVTYSSAWSSTKTSGKVK